MDVFALNSVWAIFENDAHEIVSKRGWIRMGLKI